MPAQARASDDALFRTLHEQNPLFSSEQIKVPPQLPDVLKNFAKHMIRTNPSDVTLAAFQYFDKLCKSGAGTGAGAGAGGASTVNSYQLEQLYKSVAELPDLLNKPTLEKCFKDAGLPDSLFHDVWGVGGWSPSEASWRQVCALAVSSTASGLTGAIERLINVSANNDTVNSELIIDSARYLVGVSPDVHSEFVEALASSLTIAGKHVSRDAAHTLLKEAINRQNEKADSALAEKGIIVV